MGNTSAALKRQCKYVDLPLRQVLGKQEQFMKLPLWLQRRTELTLAQKSVLVTIMFHAQDGKTAWPSVHRLARLNGISEKTVKTAIKKLKNLGIIEIDRRGSYNAHNVYTFIDGVGSVLYKWMREYSENIQRDR